MYTVSQPTQPAIRAGTHDKPSPPHGLDAFRSKGWLEVYRKSLGALLTVNPSLAIRLATDRFFYPRRRSQSGISKLPAGYQPICVYHNLKKLAAYRWGTTGPTVLLVHGWESHMGSMAAFIEPLLAAGYSVIAVDAPGHGRSPQASTHMMDFGDAILSVIEQHGPVYAVVANSLGASAAALMLARASHIRVSKLMLISPLNHIKQQIDIFMNIVGFPPDFHNQLEDSIRLRLPIPLAQCDVSKALASIETDSMIIHDASDRLIPVVTSEMMVASRPKTKLLITHGLGHRHILRDTCIHQKMLQFLSSTVPDYVTIKTF